MIYLSYIDLVLAASLVLLLALLSFRVDKKLGNQILIAALRTTVQLLLIGLVLKLLFEQTHWFWVMLMASVMWLLAGREVQARQQYRLKEGWGYGVGTLSMFLSSVVVVLFALFVIIGQEPWYEPQYSIPLLGMLLGNTMNGVSLGMDRFNREAWQQRTAIEARLMLGHTAKEAVKDARRSAVHAGFIPIVNAMAAAGVISLPGMMTGQILAGAPPVEAVKYQILIMFLIAVGTGLGTLAAVSLSAHRVFDERERLRLDRIQAL